MQDYINTGAQHKKIAGNSGIKANEIKLFANNFEHKDIVLSRAMLEKEQSNKASILIQNAQTSQPHKPKSRR